MIDTQKKCILLGLLWVVFMTGTVTAITSSGFTQTGTLTPGENQSFGYMTVTSPYNNTNISSIQDTSPFPTYYQANTTRTMNESVFNWTITGNPGGDFPPGDGTFTVFPQLWNESTSVAASYTVEEVKNWTVTHQSLRDRVSTGVRTGYANLTVEETGNVEEQVDTSLSGNISTFLSVDSQISLPPDNPQNLTVQANSPSDTSFGRYMGWLNLSTDNQSHAVRLNTVFADTTQPQISDVSGPDVSATVPDYHTLEASDNLAVVQVNATVKRLDEGGNTTENKSVGQVTFSHDDGTNTWRVLPPSNTTGTHYMEITAWDASGNTDNHTTTYEVLPLNVIDFKTDLTIPLSRIETTRHKEIGTIKQDTDVSITLDSFNQPLESVNETWTVGIQTPGGNSRFFNAVSETITFTGQGPVELFVRSDTGEVFNGRLNVSGVPQHVPISPVRFSGEFSNVTVPEDQNFTVFDTTHTCDAVRSTQLNESGWGCEYFVSADVVRPGTTLGDNIRTVIPSDVQENFVQEKNRRINELQTDVETTRKYMWGAILTTLLSLIFTAYVIKFSEYDYSVDLSEPRTKQKQLEELRGEAENHG